MISVLIPAHNERENLKTLIPYLRSLKSYNGIEIIISSSFSDKDSYQDLSNSKDVFVVKCTATSRALQMNTAASLSKGDILVFLHADVIPPRSFFEDMSTAISDGSDAGFFSYRFDRENFFLKINASFTGKDGFFTGGGDQCLFINQDVFKSLGGFDEEQLVMEDFEFFSRMKKSKINYTIVQNDLIVSARKYDNNSYLKVNLTNLMLVVLFKLGTSSKRLKGLHNKCLNLDF